ncbi:MAG: GH3 auxin-responsive promoter family protein [Geobacteraceae bacterium]
MINIILKKAAAARSKSFHARDPRLIQRNIFARLLSRGSRTRFGKDHGFDGLLKLPFEKAYRCYRENVPIRTYADFWQEYFAAGYRETNGRPAISLDNITWPERVPFYCETSGTTAPTKFIPFSREMFAENRRAALDLMSCYLAGNDSSRLFGGKLLYMAGDTRLKEVGDGALSGDMSAITLKNRPSYLRPFLAPDARTATLPWEEKLEEMARLLLAGDTIRGISGVPPWILLLLKKCAEMGGKEVSELLPHLELIIHGGTSMKPYRAEFERLFGPRQPTCLELLPSSEAFMAFQVLGEEQMRLTPYYGVFFEFVPFEALDERGCPRPDARVVPLEEIELNQRYAVILTTCAGLWRYHIGDTLRFTSRDPLFIEFTGRDRFLDRFEEKVTQGEVEEAIAALNRIPGVDVREFLVGPQIAGRRHLWLLALRQGSISDSTRFAEHLDASLAGQNADYATFRSQGRIERPEVVPVEEGLIYAWSKEIRGKLGGQSKIPHIDPTPDGEMTRSLLEFACQADLH